MKKAVIITGAGSGIGKACALEFSAMGYFIYLIGRNKEKLESVALLCKNGARRYSCDLNNETDIEKTVVDILQQKDTDIQILVNNAGIFQQHDFAAGGLDIWKAQFATNLFGSVSMTQKIYPYFKKQKKGSILNVSSTLGLKPMANVSAYSASKAAMINWTQSLALESAGFGIRVNCVCPGLVDTPIHPFHSLPAAEKSKTLESMKDLQPLGRVGTPEDIAKSVAFLACENSSWTTGAVLSVDGGIGLK